jgi:hypothetical protein
MSSVASQEAHTAVDARTARDCGEAPFADCSPSQAAVPIGLGVAQPTVLTLPRVPVLPRPA